MEQNTTHEEAIVHSNIINIEQRMDEEQILWEKIKVSTLRK